MAAHPRSIDLSDRATDERSLATVLRVIADGERHPLDALAAASGVHRDALELLLVTLRDAGLSIEITADAARTTRFAPLDASRIAAHLVRRATAADARWSATASWDARTPTRSVR